jgi:hypothetical protein
MAALERLARWLHATYVAAQATSGARQVTAAGQAPPPGWPGDSRISSR